MRWFLVCLCVSATVSVELRCDRADCIITETDNSSWAEINIQGDEIKLKYTGACLSLDCGGSRALYSSSIPHFTSIFLASNINLENCPLPNIGNASFVNVLVSLNVTLQPTNGETVLNFKESPSEPALSPDHFIGLERLTNLSIVIERNTDKPVPLSGSFARLQNLRSLELRGVLLTPNELQRLPNSIRSLDLSGESIKILPENLSETISEVQSALPNIKKLTIEACVPVNRTQTTKVTEEQKNLTSSLETVRIYFWQEERLTALKHCEQLRTISINKFFSLIELPERFIAECSRLEELRVNFAPQLGQLPAKLLEGATALKRLTIKSCVIEMLPEGIFQETPNLIELDLSVNQLKTLPSNIFLGLSLKWLSLRDNLLDDNAQNILAGLTSLRNLYLSRNHFNDFCDIDGYSPLVNSTQLRILDLSENDITHICRDWREKMSFLEILNLQSAKIKQLRYFDFQYIRDASIKESTVHIGEWPTIVDFTEEDYKNALKAPATGTTLQFANEYTHESYFKIKCDCSMYWLRKAAEDASQAIKIKDLICNNNRRFKDMTPEELCPSLSSKTS